MAGGQEHIAVLVPGEVESFGHLAETFFVVRARDGENRNVAAEPDELAGRLAERAGNQNEPLHGGVLGGFAQGIVGANAHTHEGYAMRVDAVLVGEKANGRANIECNFSRSRGENV